MVPPMEEQLGPRAPIKSSPILWPFTSRGPVGPQEKQEDPDLQEFGLLHLLPFLDDHHSRHDCTPCCNISSPTSVRTFAIRSKVDTLHFPRNTPPFQAQQNGTGYVLGASL